MGDKFRDYGGKAEDVGAFVGECGFNRFKKLVEG